MNKPRIPLPVIYLLTILTMIFWGSSFIFVKLLYKSFHPFTVFFMQMLFSAIILNSYGLLRKETPRLTVGDFKFLLLLSILNPFLGSICVSIGVQKVQASLASVIMATVPVFVPVFAWLRLREKCTLAGIAGILISFSGVCYLSYNTGGRSDSTILGLSLLYLAVFCGVASNVMMARALKRFSPSFLTRFQMSAGAIFFLPLVLIWGRENLSTSLLSSRLIIYLFYLSFVPTTLAQVLYKLSISKIGVNKAVVFTYLVPVVTAVLAWPVLGETLTTTKIACIVLVMAGVAYSQKQASGQSEK